MRWKASLAEVRRYDELERFGPMPLNTASMQRAEAYPGATSSDPAPANGVALLERLALALESASVPYCQWKGHSTAHGWMAGWGDVDLLVGREARPVFLRIAGELGFKFGLLPGTRQLPGVESFFGFDPAVPRLLHLHVHYQLVLGEYWRTSYHLPVEPEMLATAVRGELFPVPAPTYQFLIFVLRMVLLQRGRLLLRTGDRWRRGLQIPLDNLEALYDRKEMAALLHTHLPTIDLRFLDRCVASLQGKHGVLGRILLKYLLQRRLWHCSRRPSVAALLNSATEKVAPLSLGRRIADERVRFPGGGTVVALVGGVGAGKSTCARELDLWLSTDFATMRARLGNPPRTLLTMVVGGVLKAQSAMNRLLGWTPTATSRVEMLRHLCTARDRYRLYTKVQRFTARGGIAICERYPISELPAHVGLRIPAFLPATPPRFSRFLQSAEARYYECMRRPDLLFVLRLDPEIAVARKSDEPADYLRDRGRMIWKTDWSKSGAQVLDAGRTLVDVLDDLKGRVWHSL